jgi:hypothetical protein
MTSSIISIATSVNHQIVPRVKFGVFALQEGVNTILQFALAGINGQADLYSSLLTGGTKSMRLASASLEVGFGKSLAKVFMNLLRVVNPNATRAKKKELGEREEFETPPGLYPAKQLPLYLVSLAKKQQQTMNFFNHSSWWINRNISARIVAPLSSVIAILGGLGNLAFAAYNIGASIVTLGKNPIRNAQAYHALKSPGFMLNQLRQGVLGFYRPALLSLPKPPAEEDSETKKVVDGIDAQPAAECSGD